MAQRRMFSLQIVDTDAFLDMPSSSQLLYFHLAMRADDEGFISNHKKIMKTIGSQDDDLRVLLSKRFIIQFSSGIIIIKHWRIHNYIQSDRFHKTRYEDEKKQIILKENGAYTECIQNGYRLDTEVSIGKVSIDKVSKEKEGDKSPDTHKKFIIPSVQEIQQYLDSKNITTFTANKFFNHYESNGWMVGKNKMKNWHSAASGWNERAIETKSNPDKKLFRNRDSFIESLPDGMMKKMQDDPEYLKKIGYGTGANNERKQIK